MSKITQYLSEHVLGEVTSNESVRRHFSKDNSILTITPEIVVSPRVTNDVRKVARFTWQLAEKGHLLPITVRGGGTDKTGASIGKGIILNTPAHLNKILFISQKSKDLFVHAQPGVKFSTLNEALKALGMIVPSFPNNSLQSTVGGAIGNNIGGLSSGKSGNVGEWVKRLEIVLANGDLIEVSRINRKELDKKKGLQSFEGELYRKIDGIIEDHQTVIDEKIGRSGPNNIGYPGIADVKLRDGSFDLTPLIVGSQGTLGIISEVVLRADFYSQSESIIVAAFESGEAARDAADIVESFQPSSLELIDGELYNVAHSYGKKYPFMDAEKAKFEGCILFAAFNDFSDKSRKKKMKNTLKKLSKFGATILTSDEHSIDELYAIRDVMAVCIQPESNKHSLPSLIDGASVPCERREEFIAAIAELAKKHHIELPIIINWLAGTIYARPTLELANVGDKQKTFKLINDYAELVAKFDGSLVSDAGEGRLKATAAYAHLDSEVLDVYTQIRSAFDPFNTLNPGVKQSNDLKTLVSQLDPNFNLSRSSEYSPID